MSAPQQLSTLRNGGDNLPSFAPGFDSLQSFELIQRIAKLFSNSSLVPSQYRAVIEKTDKYGNVTDRKENPGALPNCIVAVNMAQRMKADPLMVMQNLAVIEGRPSWSSVWIIASINSCGRFSPLHFDLKDLGEKEVEYTITEWVDKQKTTRKAKTKIKNQTCVAWAIEKETGERLESPTVSIEMAVMEGWYQKNGSKWQTMPEVMLRYRTASFFGKIYSPELLMGLQSQEDIEDMVIEARPDASGSYSVDVDALKTANASATATSTETVEIDNAVIVDTETGEIINEEESQEDAIYNDAIEAAQKGDYDLALDLSRDLDASDRKNIGQVIENHKRAQEQAATQAQPTTRTRAPRGNMGGIE